MQQRRKIKQGAEPANMQSNHLVVDGSLNLIKLEDMGNLAECLYDEVIRKILPWRDFEKARAFGEARSFAQGLNLKNGDEWKAYVKSGRKPGDIPADPRNHYKDKG